MRPLAQRDEEEAIAIEDEAGAKVQFAFHLRLLAENDLDIFQGAVVLAQRSPRYRRAVPAVAGFCKAQLRPAVCFAPRAGRHSEEAALAARVSIGHAGNRV